MIKSILIELLAIFLSFDKAKPHNEIQDDEFVKFINDYIKNHIHEKNFRKVSFKFNGI